MVGFLADENVESYLVAALEVRMPSVHITSVHDIGLAATDDRAILEWAANNERLIVTRDISSMRAYANARVESGMRMPDLVIIQSTRTIAEILESLEEIALYSLEGEWEGQVLFIEPRPPASPRV